LFGVLGEHLPDNKIIMNSAKPSDRSSLLLEVTCSTKRQNERIAKLPRALIAVLLGDRTTDAALSGVPPMEKRELSKIDFELIEGAFKALLQSRPDPMTADKITDLRDNFRDAFTGWLEIEKEAA
jgi:hypothetical protein